jgi:hypothetical protein
MQDDYKAFPLLMKYKKGCFFVPGTKAHKVCTVYNGFFEEAKRIATYLTAEDAEFDYAVFVHQR